MRKIRLKMKKIIKTLKKKIRKINNYIQNNKIKVKMKIILIMFLIIINLVL